MAQYQKHSDFQNFTKYKMVLLLTVWGGVAIVTMGSDIAEVEGITWKRKKKHLQKECHNDITSVLLSKLPLIKRN